MQFRQLQELAVSTYHQPLLSVEDQLCRGRVVCLEVVCSCPLGTLVLGFPQAVKGKVSSHLCFACSTLPEL